MNRELTVEDVMEIGNKLRKQAIATAAPEELSDQVRKRVIAAASPQERLAGMAPEEMAKLLAQIEAMLSKQKVNRKTHRTRPRKRK